MSDATILVADDEADMRVLVRAYLSRSPFWEVVEAEDGEAALRLCRSRLVDAVVLDQRMPKLTGIEVARALRGEDFLAPILLFSAYLDAEIVSEATDLGVVTVAKSDIRSLPGLVRQALERPQSAAGPPAPPD